LHLRLNAVFLPSTVPNLFSHKDSPKKLLIAFYYFLFAFFDSRLLAMSEELSDHPHGSNALTILKRGKKREEERNTKNSHQTDVHHHT
jgi:hypothetical protein